MGRFPQEEAVVAVDNLFLSAYWTLTRHLPINAFGFFLYFVLVGLGVALAGWAYTMTARNGFFWVFVLLGAAWSLHHLHRFGQHAGATLTALWGAKGRGRVIRSAVMREDKQRNGYFVVVLFEVVPDDGSPTFVDQETLFVGPQTSEKLAPGNVIRVRYDGAREHVFPVTPVEIIGTV